MVVRYDSRGTGLSDRDVTDFSLESLMLDLEAVVQSLGSENHVLFGNQNSGSVAIAHAVRYPERVSHLILWCSLARGTDYAQSPRAQALRSVRDMDWELYTESVAHAGLGWSGAQEAHEAAALLRECVTQKTAQAMIGAVG